MNNGVTFHPQANRRPVTIERVYAIIQARGPIRRRDIERVFRRKGARGIDAIARQVIACIRALQQDAKLLKTIGPDTKTYWNAL